MKRPFKLGKLVWLLPLFALLTACGGGGGGSTSTPPPPGSTACVLGTSTLGNCTL